MGYFGKVRNMATRHKAQFSIMSIMVVTAAFGIGLGLARHTIPALDLMPMEQVRAVFAASALTIAGLAVLLVALIRRSSHA